MSQLNSVCDDIRREGGLKALCYLLTKVFSIVNTLEHVARLLTVVFCSGVENVPPQLVLVCT